MARTVKVGLALEVADYVKGADQAERSTKDLGEELADAARQGDKTATAMDNAAGGMSEAARAAGALDRQIDELSRSLQELAIKQALAGDAGGDLAKQIKAQQAELRQATRGRKLIDPGDVAPQGMEIGATLGVSTAQGFAASFQATGKTMLHPAALVVGAAVVATIAPIVGAGLAGAVIGGAGAGGVIGGIAVVSRDSRVAASAAELGEVFRSTLEVSALAMIPATQRGIGILRREIHDAGSELESIFDQAATFVEPLSRGAANFIRPIIDGFEDLVSVAGPVVREIETGMGRIGDAIGDSLTLISDESGEGASAVAALSMMLEQGIRAGGEFVVVLADMYRGILTAAAAYSVAADNFTFDFLPGGEKIKDNRDRLHELKDAMNDGSSAASSMGDTVPGAFDRVKTAADGTASAVERVKFEYTSLADMVGGIVDNNLALAEAQLRLKSATKEAADAVDGKRKVSSREQETLLGLAQSLNTTTTAMDKTGVSADQAAAAHGRNRKQLYDAAIAAGYTKTEANALAAQWLKVPKNVKTNVTESGSAAVKAAIASIPNRKDVHVAMRLTGYANVSGTIAALRKNQRHGGIYERAQEGLLNEAAYYTPRNPGRYMIAEPGTGGEAFVPRNGDYSRSMDILNGAARWYGAQVVPGGSGGGQAVVHNHHYTINAGGGFYGNRSQALDWLVGLLDEAKMRGRA
jgi:ABC-type transporter Mla subunit MlaD